MAKRLFGSMPRSEYILSYQRDKGENVSLYINNSVIDEAIPVYSSLRVYALHLLDYASGDSENWTGSKLSGLDFKYDIDKHIRETLCKGVAWLQQGHCIKGKNVLRNIISHYQPHPTTTDGKNITKISGDTQRLRQRIIEQLTKLDPEYSQTDTSLLHLANTVLDHWDSMWENEDAYSILSAAILYENPSQKIDPMEAVTILQNIETQYIKEAIKE